MCSFNQLNNDLSLVTSSFQVLCAGFLARDINSVFCRIVCPHTNALAGSPKRGKVTLTLTMLDIPCITLFPNCYPFNLQDSSDKHVFTSRVENSVDTV